MEKEKNPAESVIFAQSEQKKIVDEIIKIRKEQKISQRTLS